MCKYISDIVHQQLNDRYALVLVNWVKMPAHTGFFKYSPHWPVSVLCSLHAG